MDKLALSFDSKNPINVKSNMNIKYVRKNMGRGPTSPMS